MKLKTVLIFAMLCGLALTTQAATVISFSPEGETVQVRQIVAKFDESAIAFGDAKAADPFDLECLANQPQKGSGHWVSARSWVFEFDRDLPAGVLCTARLRTGAKGFLGKGLQGEVSYSFNTGGPLVEEVLPGPYAPIAEDQIFALRLSGPATPESIRARVWCAVEGLGERVAVRLIDGADRATVLKLSRLEKVAERDPLSVVTLACNRTLPAATKVQLVYGKGVVSAGANQRALRTTADQRYDFEVRQPFAAELSCQRENARSGCVPILPIRLSFTAPVPVELLRRIRLISTSLTIPAALVVDADSDQGSDVATAVSFSGAIPENTDFSIDLPANLKDDSERPLSNAKNFPMAIKTGPMPVLAKFSAAPFGVVERFAEPDSAGQGILPLTLRNVEPQLNVKDLAVPAPRGQVTDVRLISDADIVAWYRKNKQYDNMWVERAMAQRDAKSALPPPEPTPERKNDQPNRQNTEPAATQFVETRTFSLLSGLPSVTQVDLPVKLDQDKRPFEVIGIPLSAGFHIVEVASQKLGAALLEERLGKTRTMYVRTAVLVTNLGVHFKLGRENSVAWVTTLDQGKPVAGATVQVSDCSGRAIAQGVTNAEGLANFKGISPQAPTCDAQGVYSQAYFVSARAQQPQSDSDRGAMIEDLAFTWTDWDKGIEPWRFNVPTSQAAIPDTRMHTIFDRTLVRAGETVSMKHLIRAQTIRGFDRVDQPPRHFTITHVGSGQQFNGELAWKDSATGGQFSLSRFTLPANAKLGLYKVSLAGDNGEDVESGAFRVEEFRLPILAGQISPEGQAPLVHTTSLPVRVQVHYLSGGNAANLPVQVSALLREKNIEFPQNEGFTFFPPQPERVMSNDDNQDAAAQQVIANKLPLVLDQLGAGLVTIDPIPLAGAARELVLEATYADPNGEIQTIRSTHVLWPANVVAGLKTENWVSSGDKINMQALALNLEGQAQANVSLEVRAVAHRVESSRKRMVGGFYSYENRTVTKNLGTLCQGLSDAKGLLLCEARLDQPGEVELVVTAKDAAGNQSHAASSVYVTRQGELWFGGNDNDRMDVLPEKKNYQPGETATFQVRMPFRAATALVAIEREGVLETQVVELRGQDPTIAVEIKPTWGPNVYVSVLALRGRLRVVPWYSFFTWGYRSPSAWWSAYSNPDSKDYVPATALVDLSKPTYRFGMAAIQVGDAAHRLGVSVETDKTRYPVRGQVQVTITVTRPDKKPAAHAEVAVAAVDKALLELMPNKSWNVLEAMLEQRAWGVSTSTAQMEIIGRRHYGRKAVPAGGSGGRSATRELFDTLLLWNPLVVLDANGQARLTVPLNDSISAFEIVAVADMSTGLFGTGRTSIQSTQDLQIISGLPPLVREQDQYRAQFTLRNTTNALMKLMVTPHVTGLEFAPQALSLAPNEAGLVSWQVTAPMRSRTTAKIDWEIEAKDTLSKAQDALKVSQRLVPVVPIAVQQATLSQLDDTMTLSVKQPVGALPGQGGLQLSLNASLAQGLPGVRTWFINYPFACLEQGASKALGLRDQAMWQKLLQQMPGYLDADGLANYFPTHDGDDNHGSDVLTAYLLAAAHEAQTLDAGFALPAGLATSMLDGLAGFVEGRIERQFWSPLADLDVRKIAAIEALSRYGKAHPKMLDSIAIEPKLWPTHAVIDWLNILKRMPAIRQREKHIALTQKILRARLNVQGTRVTFSTERDDQWWWMMQNGDANAARLLLTVMNDPTWRSDLAGLTTGLLARQQKGAWSTTTSNLWGSLAVEKFSKAFENTPVAGTVTANLGKASASLTMPAGGGQAQGDLAMLLPWPAGNVAAPLTVAFQGTGKPWLTLQSLAAVPVRAPRFAGYQVKRSVTPVEQADKSLPAATYSRGDVLRVTLEVNASADMTWVALTDPIPAGATILGSGMGRDSVMATQREADDGTAWLAYQERSFESFRAYYEYLPKGISKIQYTIRLNNVGVFSMPATRVEAMYAPEMFGEAPNSKIRVQ